MLPDIFVKGEVATKVHGFSVAAELVDGTKVESIMDRIGDGLSFIEGVGSVSIEYLGTEVEGDDEELETVDVKDIN